MPPQKKLASLEMFTGAGGLALATYGAGFKHEALLEWNTDACDTLRYNTLFESLPGIKNWPVIEGDVRAVSFKQFEGLDLVAGGPPCQPFSIGGKHRGKTDNRDMIPEFIRAVREIHPKAFIMENVRGLTRQSFRNYFSYVTLQLTHPEAVRKSGETWTSHLERLETIQTEGRHDSLHYNLVYRVLNAADYGVPQTRDRVFIVGFRSDLPAIWHFPSPTHSKNRLLFDQWISGEYWDRHQVRRPAGYSSLNQRNDRLSSLDSKSSRPWRTVRDALQGLPEPCLKKDSRFQNHRLQPGARSYAGHTGSHLDLPSKTLKAGDHGVPGGENMILYPDGRVRYYSVREAARIQTFPDEWFIEGPWTEAMRQLGNAVPITLAQVVAESVAKELRKYVNE